MQIRSLRLILVNLRRKGRPERRLPEALLPRSSQPADFSHHPRGAPDVLTKPPHRVAEPNRRRFTPPPEPDDESGYVHRQVIGYLGLALPVLLVQVVKCRPNPASDVWAGTSVSAYYWTGAVAIFAGILAGLSIFLLTYRGYANEAQKYDRAVTIIAGISAALVALFPTTPPDGLVMKLAWWHPWVGVVHTSAAVSLVAMFALFSLWLFRKKAPGERPTRDKRRRDRIYLLCGLGILGSMGWAFIEHLGKRSIFWPESFALMFFATSWLVKGRALHTVKAVLHIGSTSPHPED